MCSRHLDGRLGLGSFVGRGFGHVNSRWCLLGALAVSSFLGCGGDAHPPVLSGDPDAGAVNVLPDARASVDAAGADVPADRGMTADVPAAPPSITGLWRNASVAPCVEEHYFWPDRTYTIGSTASRRIAGFYTFRAGVAGARGTLSVTFTLDNGKPGCGGAPLIDTDHSHNVFVEFSANFSRVTLYLSPTGSDVWLTLVRP